MKKNVIVVDTGASIRAVIEARAMELLAKKRGIIEDFASMFIGPEVKNFTSGVLIMMLSDYANEKNPGYEKINVALEQVSEYDKLIEEYVLLKEKIREA